MLNKASQKWLFFVTFALLSLIQLISAAHHQLFGDEAFYWLESQHLSWSYAELPGWTQWMIALSQKLFPQTEFFIRLPGLLAAFSLPFIGMAISKTINPVQNHWQSGLLLLTLPLLSLAGILAIPDIWVIFFGLLSVLLLMQCIQKEAWQWYVLLGLMLAIGINVHIRFWIVIFIAAIVTVWQYRTNPNVIKKLLGLTLPVLLLGFVPILIFNTQHDFPLLSFQLKERHPWTFQPGHIKFFFIQILITTPVVFFLAFNTTRLFKQLNPLQRLMVTIAVIHWFVYAVVGFFSDDLRFNIHWTLLSYVLLLVVAGSSSNDNRLKTWSFISGYLGTTSFMAWLYFSLHVAQPVSKLNAQFTENARGWKELSLKTEMLLNTASVNAIIADNFMTFSTLKFYLKKNFPITALPHPLNQKHGRQVQLDIMQYTQKESKNNNLLVVEHSALKLEQAIPFYQQACQTLNGIKLIDTLDYAEGIKSFYFFETGHETCELPPVIYTEQSEGLISGWVLSNKSASIDVLADPNSKPINLTETDIGNNPLFKGLDPNTYHLNQFSFNQKSLPANNQLSIKFKGLLIYSQQLEN